MLYKLVSLCLAFSFFGFVLFPGSSKTLDKEATPEFSYFIPAEAICNSDGIESCLSDPEDQIFANLSIAERMLLNSYEISEEMEREIGEEFHNSATFNYVRDERYDVVQKVFNKIKPYVGRKEVNYRIYLIEDDVVNAWTVPGGAIYITTGIYEFMESTDELANVIGHEIGHNECKHTHKQLQRQGIAQNVTGWFGMGETIDASFFVNLGSMALMAFGQRQELESDRTGFYLSSKAGYNPRAGLEFWRRMSEHENENRLEKVIRSHPYSSTRYSCGIDYLDNHKK